MNYFPFKMEHIALCKTGKASVGDSAWVVSQELEQRHMDAAVYIHENFGLPISTYALHNIINNYEFIQDLAKLPVDSGFLDLSVENDFCPAYLYLYFKEKNHV